MKRSFYLFAAIVKGGNAANAYFYPGGSMGDKNLCSPVNRSGKLAGYEGRWHRVFPWSIEGVFSASRVFRINFNEITL